LHDQSRRQRTKRRRSRSTYEPTAGRSGFLGKRLQSQVRKRDASIARLPNRKGSPLWRSFPPLFDTLERPPENYQIVRWLRRVGDAAPQFHDEQGGSLQSNESS